MDKPTKPRKNKPPKRLRNRPLYIPLPFETVIEALLRTKPKKRRDGKSNE